MTCQDTTKEGLPCPANARRRPDPDGRRRCPQHSVEPSVRQAIQLSRVRAGLVSAGQRPADVKYDRFGRPRRWTSSSMKACRSCAPTSGFGGPTRRARPRPLPSSPRRSSS